MDFARAEFGYFFSNGEDAGFAGDDEQAMGRIAKEPARPLQTARVDGAIKAMPDQGLGNETG
jgi:hypothetical protein